MKTLLLILIILTSYQAKSQLEGQAKIDSLLKELPKMKEDTNAVNLLQSLSFEYRKINPDEGIKYGRQGLKLAEKIDWLLGKSKCYNSLGSNNLQKSDTPKALDFFNQSLKINEKIQNKYGIASNLVNIGIIFLYQSNFPKALEKFYKALKIFENIKSKDNIATVLGNIGIVYHNQSNFPKALEYYNKSIKINEEIGNKGNIASNLGNIGNIYITQSKFNQALEYYNKAIKINEEIGNKSNIATNLGNIVAIYINQSNYSKALEYSQKALKINEEFGDKLSMGINLGNIGEIYFTQAQDSIIKKSENRIQFFLNKEKNLSNAINYLKQSIEILKNVGELDAQAYFLNTLSLAYELKDDYKKSLYIHKKYKLLNDSIYSIEKSKEIAILENERNHLEAERIASEKARIEAEKIAQRNRLQYLGIGAMVIGLGIILIITGRMKLKDWVSRALVFISLIFLFEFMLVLLDPWTDEISEGIPLIKFAINMIIAFIIFPIHQYLEKRVSKSIIKIE